MTLFPVPGYSVTRGSTAHLADRQKAAGDIAALPGQEPIYGTPIVAPVDGFVDQYSLGNDAGNFVLLWETDTVRWGFAHLLDFGLVGILNSGAGIIVAKGDIIGYVGISGLDREPTFTIRGRVPATTADAHLHFYRERLVGGVWVRDRVEDIEWEEQMPRTLKQERIIAVLTVNYDQRLRKLLDASTELHGPTHRLTRELDIAVTEIEEMVEALEGEWPK